MNTHPTPKDVILTMTYEYLPVVPKWFRAVTPVWLDITPDEFCGNSEYPVPANRSAFAVEGIPWEATIDGEVVFAGAHVHDGGITLEIMKNNDTVCTSTASYGATAGYVEKVDANLTMGGMGKDVGFGIDTVHVSSMSSCTELGDMRKGQDWWVRATYNFKQHAPMLDMDGSLSKVMGIVLLYVAEWK
jgi:hypothetical protein